MGMSDFRFQTNDIYDLIKRRGQMSKNAMIVTLGISQVALNRHLSKLRGDGKIDFTGYGINTMWFPIEEKNE